MSKRRNLLFGAALSVVSLSLAAPHAAAQQAPDDVVQTPQDAAAEAADDDTIIVTGSRIRRPVLEGVISGASISEELIEQRGYQNTLDALNELPFVGTGLTPVGGQAGFGAGAAFTDVLDLGSARTLTLVNGRRFVSANNASLFVGGNATGIQVDLNSIPSTLIERLDVVRGGQGGVAYGTDGVGGVVNAILRDDYDGIRFDFQGGISGEGDASSYRFSSTYGKNFANDRGNFTVSFEYNLQNGLTGDQREFSTNGVGSLAQPFGVRNPTFAPAIPTQPGFLPAASDDLFSSLAFLPGGIRTGAGTDGGAIFRVDVAPTASVLGLNPTFGTFSTFLSGVTQLVPGGTGLGGFPSGALAGSTPAALAACGFTFTCFAPATVGTASGLPPGVTAASVISALAPGFNASGGTAAQQTALAIALLQQNRPTVREFFQANPGTDPNLFLGQFLGEFPEIPNTNPATSALFPSIAVPLRFDDAGNIVPFNLGLIDPNLGATFGAIPGGGDGFFRPDLVNLLTEQERFIGFLTGRYELTPKIRFKTELLATSIQNQELANGPSANFVTTAVDTSPENTGIFIAADNAFLTSANRAALAAVGIPLNPSVPTGTTVATANGFTLSRSNADLLGANPTFTDNLTFRTSNILEADLDLFGKEWRADASFTYGRVRGNNVSSQISDLAFNLAKDAVVNPANGEIVCRAQLTPPNANAGILTFPGVGEQLPVVTQALIDACEPLNLFGVNNFSQAARDFVVVQTEAKNVSQQFFAQASLTGELFDLPAGPLGVSTVFEWRREALDFTVDPFFGAGRTRAVGIANTSGAVRTFEGAFEFRAPILGDDFKIPFVGNSFALEGGVRAVANSATGRNVIWTGGGTYSPIEGITFRGNRSRTARAASIVELFLAPQGAFFGGIAGDPCSFLNIATGPNPAQRAANCQAQVTAFQQAGTLPSTFSLAGFQSFIPTLPGVFVGNPDLEPEVSNSWNVGVALRPSFIPGLELFVDYIDLLITDSITLATAGVTFTTCFDSPNFPDVSSEVGINTCDLFQRNPTTFQPQSITGTAINLGALELQQLDSTITYRFDVQDFVGLFGAQTGDLGQIRLRGDVTYTRSFETSSNGTFSDAVQGAGSLARPDFQTRLDATYEKGPLTFLFQWFYDDASVLNNTTPDLNDAADVFFFPSVSIFNASVTYDINDNWTVRFVANNISDRFAVLDNFTAVDDPIGRRFLLGVIGRF